MRAFDCSGQQTVFVRPELQLFQISLQAVVIKLELPDISLDSADGVHNPLVIRFQETDIKSRHPRAGPRKLVDQLGHF